MGSLSGLTMASLCGEAAARRRPHYGFTVALCAMRVYIYIAVRGSKGAAENGQDEKEGLRV